MKKILLLSTGGTIASVPSKDGLVPGMSGEVIVSMVPKLAGMCEIDFVELMNLDSSNLEPNHWQEMALAVGKYYHQYDGFVISHGTDTMAYSAAALSYMLQNCQKPVVFTGSQLPMGVEGSDAPANVLHSFMAACSDLKGVAIAFGNKLIYGECGKKLYTEDFNGFSSINREPLAVLDGTINWQCEEHFGAAYGEGEFTVKADLEIKVAVIKITPGTRPDILEYYQCLGYKGIVLESYGAGGVPNAANNWLPTLEKVLKSGVKVVCASQCLYDGVDLGKYPIGILAHRLGAQSAGLLTVEACAVKLMWELANK